MQNTKKDNLNIRGNVWIKKRNVPS